MLVAAGRGAAPLVSQIALRAVVATAGVRLAAAAAATAATTGAAGSSGSRVAHRAPSLRAIAMRGYSSSGVSHGGGGGSGGPAGGNGLDAWERWQAAQAAAGGPPLPPGYQHAKPYSREYHGEYYQRRWARGGKWYKEDGSGGDGRYAKPRGGAVKRELLILKNGILTWWQQMKEAGRYLRVISMPPAVAQPRLIPGSPTVDPFPALMTARDARYLTALARDTGMGTLAAFATLNLGGGCLLLAAVNYWYPSILPTGFAASRAAYSARFGVPGAPRPLWRWREDHLVSVPYYTLPGAATAGAATAGAATGAGGAGAATPPAPSPWDVPPPKDGTTMMTNVAVVQSLPDAALVSLAQALLAGTGTAARPATPRWQGGTSADGEGDAGMGLAARLRRIFDELPHLMAPSLHGVAVPTSELRAALDSARASSAGSGGGEGGATRALRFAVAKYCDKLQVDDALLRREAAAGTGVFGDLPVVATAGGGATNPDAALPPIRLQDCFLRDAGGEVRRDALADAPPQQRALAELAVVAEQRMIPATLRRAGGGDDAALIGSAAAGLRQWLRVSQSTPVAAMFLHQARPMA